MEDSKNANLFEFAFQVGVVDFSLYKSLFMHIYTSSRASFTGLPGLSSLFGYPQRNSNPKNALPALGLKLSDLLQRLQVGYHLTTAGKFAEGIERFRALLLCIPLLVVENRQDIVEVQQLLNICKEYLLGKLNKDVMPAVQYKKNIDNK